MKMKTVKIKNINIANNLPFVLIAGPCVVENRELTLITAEAIKKITDELGIPYVFKSSYRKANRTSLESFTGLPFEEALGILNEVKNELGLPVITDVHEPSEVERAAEAADILQIPAFLCRQTSLLIAAGATGKAVNIKKGQFLAPWDMKFAAEKVESTGNSKILLTERGASFGYGNLVVDFRSLEIMKKLGYPVVMDATHSVQMPGRGGITGGEPEFIEPLSRAAAAVGIAALFLEVHPEPSKALSDPASQLPLRALKDLLVKIKKLDETVKNF